MSNTTQKLSILESLNALDQAQADKVLSYIKNLLNTSSEEEMRYQRFKREAMKEIRQAINHERILKSTQ